MPETESVGKKSSCCKHRPEKHKKWQPAEKEAQSESFSFAASALSRWELGVLHVHHAVQLQTCLTLSLEAKCQWKSDASTVLAADL